MDHHVVAGNCCASIDVLQQLISLDFLYRKINTCIASINNLLSWHSECYLDRFIDNAGNTVYVYIYFILYPILYTVAITDWSLGWLY